MAIKKIIKPGKNAPEVDYWDSYMGVPMCIRSKPVLRLRNYDLGFTEEDEKLLASIGISIENKYDLPAGTEAQRERRQDLIDELQAEFDQLTEKREKLTAFEEQQIDRCINGHGTMTGFHYFYYNFGWIQKVDEDNASITNIRPLYRSCDDWAGRLLIKVQKDKTGAVMVKRRRFGWSWILVAWIIYNLLFKDANVFFVTKDGTDQEKFYERVRFMHENLPLFLQKKKIRDAIDIKSFGINKLIAKARGKSEEEIPNAVLRCASPKNISNFAGGTCSMFIVDEAGEIPNLRGILKVGIPMLNASNGLDRAGCLLLGGTVGEMKKSGHVLKRIYMSHKPFHVIPVFVPGWMGTFFDECGNDQKELAISKIKAQIDAYESEGFVDEAIHERQKYPLEIKDAFLSNTQSKLWPVTEMSIADQLYSENPPEIEYGRFYKDKSGSIKFLREERKPSGSEMFKDHYGHGQVQIIEHPKVGASDFMDPYVAGCDPVDLDRDSFGESDGASNMMLSDISFVIYKRYEEVGGISDFPVCIYYGRSDSLDSDYEQALLACRYYENAQINIERQKGTRMYDYFRRNKALDLVATGVGIAQETDKNSGWGVHVQERWWTNMVRAGEEWWKANYNKPLIRRFIDESIDIKERNTDLMVGFLTALQLSNEMDARESMGKQKYKNKEEKTGPIALWKRNGSSFQPTRRPSQGLTNVLRKMHGHG